jgi:hypothetical protein
MEIGRRKRGSLAVAKVGFISLTQVQAEREMGPRDKHSRRRNKKGSKLLQAGV